jgi:hypothetical protein
VNEASTPSSSDSSRAPEGGIPPRLLRGIIAVRQYLPKATEFSTLFEMFDDRVVRAPGFWDHSHLRDNELLRSIAVNLATRLRPGFEAKACRIYEVGDLGFWHGAVIGTNALACIFYDERMNLGLVTLSNPFDGTNRTELVRFKPVTRDHPSESGDASQRMAC